MLQIENEYGSVLCDHVYTAWLRDLVRGQLGKDVVLYTTDGFTERMLTCGAVEGTFTTVDFGPPQTEESVKQKFEMQRKHSGGGPSVNSEFYTMWFSMWSEKSIYRQQIEPVMNALEIMWNQNASFSLYMIHGGTNFGFWSGKEPDGPVITSYDYAAPISEEGQVTPLYEAIRNWIGQKPNWPTPPLPLPPNRTGIAINNVMSVKLKNFIKVLNSTNHGSSSHQCLSSQGKPLNFEQFNQDHTFVWYSTTLDLGGQVLRIPDLHDHAYVFLDGQYKGNLTVCDRSGCVKTLALNGRLGQRLDILVESAGRLTFPLTKVDPKGILSAVLLDGKPIGQRWLQCGVDFDGLFSTATAELNAIDGEQSDDDDASSNEPSIYVAKFNTHGVDWAQMHTFFDSRGWGHGVAIVNGFNIGRYWPTLGPQMTLFVPGAVMKQENVVVLLELAGRQKSDSNIQFLDYPVLKYSEDDELDDPPISDYLRKYELASAFRRRRLYHQRTYSRRVNAFYDAKKYLDFFTQF